MKAKRKNKENISIELSHLDASLSQLETICETVKSVLNSPLKTREKGELGGIKAYFSRYGVGYTDCKRINYVLRYVMPDPQNKYGFILEETSLTQDEIRSILKKQKRGAE